ncbi:MAG: RnfABCDGE type electron transport complex subunit B [Bacillota bacterium]
MLQDVLIPFAVLGGLGLVLGLLLALASRKFAVEADPKVEAVRELLAGANCGACGFPGCNGLAAAMAEGKAPIDACPVTSRENRGKIADILGVANEETMPMVASVLCRGGKNSKNSFTYRGLQTCAGAKLVAGGPKFCAWGCIGFGDCIKACNFNAISFNEDGVPRVDRDKCVACRKCVETCPVGIIQMLPKDSMVRVECMNQNRGKDIRPICSNACIGCGLCSKACEYGAITVNNSLAAVDPQKCTACLACVAKCPTGAVVSLVKKAEEPQVQAQ